MAYMPENNLQTALESGMQHAYGRDCVADVVEIGMLTQARVQELLNYDAETGGLTWTAAAGGKLAGRRAGCVRNGHITVAIDRTIYSATRIVWLYVHGFWPTIPIRFNDENSLNLRSDNLRQALPNSARRAEQISKNKARKHLREVTEGRALTQEMLKDVLDYDPETGVFSWRQSGQGRVLGQQAGTVWNTGYRYVHIFGTDYQAARLAWLYMTGDFPAGRVKFDDKEPTNLRFSNLRLGRTTAEHNRLFNTRHPEAARRSQLSKYDGLTPAAYEAMLAGQGGGCGICGSAETATRHGRVREFCVDHDHADNKVRGVLCSDCNRGLGLFDDQPDRLRAAAAYLERHAMKKVAA